ncbi:MAG: transcriptional repressor [Bacteroidetes bacterium]|jgi:Fur family peroxide stress response transcriptional regulator|nr:transcriptional repressor [Bacteroidota bacterium]
MKQLTEQISEKIKSKDLKVTPQRMAVLKAVYELNNHPTADNIIEYVRKENPNVAMGTIYKVLDTLIENKLVKKVRTDNGVMRYDGIMENHHHLYCVECDLIEDYNDKELDKLLTDYFKKKDIKGFKLKNFVLQINGTFNKC